MLPRFDHRLAAQPDASGEALPSPWRARHSTAEETSNPGGSEVPSGRPEGRRTVDTQQRRSPSARSIPEDGSREAGRLPVAERQAWQPDTYSVRHQWETDTHETRRSRVERQCRAVAPEGNQRGAHDPPEGDRRDPSQLPHKEGAHPRCRRRSPGTRRRRRGGVDTQRNDISGSRAVKRRPSVTLRHRPGGRLATAIGVAVTWLCEGNSEEKPRRSSGARARPRTVGSGSGAFLAERAAVASTAPLPEQSP